MFCLPFDWQADTRLPFPTPPPPATAEADIILAAVEPAEIPPDLKPAPPRAAGVLPWAPAAHNRYQAFIIVVIVIFAIVIVFIIIIVIACLLMSYLLQLLLLSLKHKNKIASYYS